MSRWLAPLVALVLLAAVASRILAQETGEPAVGDQVTFLRDPAAGAAAGTVTITVNQVVDPFAAFGAISTPPGTRLVFVSLTIGNDGETQLRVNPATFFVQDADGVLGRPIDLLATTPDAGATESDRSFTVAAGATLDGGVVFAVREDAVLARIFHDPDPDRLILLASFAPARSVALTPAATTVADDNGTDQTPFPPSGGEIDCAGFAAYYDETKARLDRLETFAEDLEAAVNAVLVDPLGASTTLEDLGTELDQFADEQRNTTVPAGAESLNDQIVAMFERYAEGFRQMSTGLETLDPTAIQAAIPIVSDADALNQEVLADLAAAATACGISTES